MRTPSFLSKIKQKKQNKIYLVVLLVLIILTVYLSLLLTGSLVISTPIVPTIVQKVCIECGKWSSAGYEDICHCIGLHFWKIEIGGGYGYCCGIPIYIGRKVYLPKVHR